MSQGELLPRPLLRPEEIVTRALEAEGPVLRTYCLFSGGHDSTVTAHRCRELYDGLAYIDTGTALPGVREFVGSFATQIEKPLRVLEAGGAFRNMVLGSDPWWAWYDAEHATRTPELVARAVQRSSDERPRDRGNSPQGFPGPSGGHRMAYARLKERQVETLVRTTKAGEHRLSRVGLLAGARRQESRRRMRTQGAGGYRRAKSQVWINPLNEWTNASMRIYRLEHELPESDVAALIHRSGECNCGSYATRGEREDLQTFYPDWWRDVIAPLEEEAQRRAIARCFWGERADSGRPGARGHREFLPEEPGPGPLSLLEPDEAPGPLCSDCPTALALD